MRRGYSKTGLMMGVVVLFALILGCGSSGGSAPPVSLPTPVTGRISVTSPDADGNISVVGGDGSIDAGETVMAINTSVASLSGSAWYFKVLAALIGSAHAQTSDNFPDICSETGRACAVADENGAFVITIAASEADEVIVVAIDSVTGAERGERLTMPVPRNKFRFTQPIVDIALNPLDSDQLYVLLKGGTYGGVEMRNRVVVYDPSTKAESPVVVDTVNLGDPIELAVDGRTNTPRIAVTGLDSRGAGVVVASLDTGGGFAASDFTDETGLFAAPALTYLDLLAGSFSAFSPLRGYDFMYSINKRDSYFYSIIDMQARALSAVEAGAVRSALLGTDAVVAGTYSDSGGTLQDVPLIAMLARYSVANSDGTASALPYIVVFEEDWIFEYFLSSDNTSAPPESALIRLPAGTDAADIAFVSNAGEIMVTDRGNDAVYIYSLLSGNACSSSNFCFDSNIVSITDPDLVNPLEIAATTDYAFVTANNGDDTRPDSVMTIDLINASVVKLNPTGLLPSGIVYDGANGILYVSNYISRNVTRLSLTDLLP